MFEFWKHRGSSRIAALKETHGATLLMALLALLVATMVSAVILAAATSAVKQVKDDREFQQNQLYLQSAAQYILDDIASVTVRVPMNFNEDAQEWEPDDNGVKADDSARYMNDKIVGAVKQVHGSQNRDASTSEKFTVTFETSDNETMQELRTSDVDVIFQLMKATDPETGIVSYKMIFTFETKVPEQFLCMTLSERVNQGSRSDTTKTVDDEYEYQLEKFSIPAEEA